MFIDSCIVFQVDVVISYTNIVPNVIQSHCMSGFGMLQAQGQNAMQIKCVQMSPDDSQTSQQTLVQWHQCQCCVVCPCVHAEQLIGDWVAADPLSCTSSLCFQPTQWWEAAFGFSTALLHGIVSRSRTSCSTWSNILRTINWLSWCELLAISSTDSTCQFCCRIIASCMASRSASSQDMQIWRSSIHQSLCQQQSKCFPVACTCAVLADHIWASAGWLQCPQPERTDCESIILELSKRVLALGHRVAWVGVFSLTILGMERHFLDITSRLLQTELEICLRHEGHSTCQPSSS